MPRPHPVEVRLRDEERRQLELWARLDTRDAQSQRPRIVLAAADGLSNSDIARRLAIDLKTVRKWRLRFAQQRLRGLVDGPRSGRPRKVTDEQVKAIIDRTLGSTPENLLCWTRRSMANEVGLSETTVARIWRAFGLHPYLHSILTRPPSPHSRQGGVWTQWREVVDPSRVRSLEDGLERYRELTTHGHMTED
jgi:transposase